MEKLDHLVAKLDLRSSKIKEFDWLFSQLERQDIQHLKLTTDRLAKQSSFQLGELLMVWGRARTGAGCGSTQIHFTKRKFANPEEINISLIGYDENEGYPVIVKVSESSFKCRFIRKRSGIHGYHTVKNEAFRYFAISRAKI